MDKLLQNKITQNLVQIRRAQKTDKLINIRRTLVEPLNVPPALLQTLQDCLMDPKNRLSDLAQLSNDSSGHFLATAHFVYNNLEQLIAKYESCHRKQIPSSTNYVSEFYSILFNVIYNVAHSKQLVARLFFDSFLYQAFLFDYSPREYEGPLCAFFALVRALDLAALTEDQSANLFKVIANIEDVDQSFVYFCGNLFNQQPNGVIRKLREVSLTRQNIQLMLKIKHKDRPSQRAISVLQLLGKMSYQNNPAFAEVLQQCNIIQELKEDILYSSTRSSARACLVVGNLVDNPQIRRQVRETRLLSEIVECILDESRPWVIGSNTQNEQQAKDRTVSFFDLIISYTFELQQGPEIRNFTEERGIQALMHILRESDYNPAQTTEHLILALWSLFQRTHTILIDQEPNFNVQIFCALNGRVHLENLGNNHIVFQEGVEVLLKMIDTMSGR